jgi:2-polyprenyl-6-methoxyphenol hydroxylase-like FAD-dependent oxidoreductase
MTHSRTAMVIGGGIAGPVAAMALHQAGIDAIVYEAHAPTTDEEVGSYLTVAVNGLDALRATCCCPSSSSCWSPTSPWRGYTATTSTGTPRHPHFPDRLTQPPAYPRGKRRASLLAASCCRRPAKPRPEPAP